MSYLGKLDYDNTLNRNRPYKCSQFIINAHKQHFKLDNINRFFQPIILKDHMLDNHIKMTQSKYHMNNEKLYN